MICLKRVLTGRGAVVLECVIVPVALVIWAARKTGVGGATIGFSPIDVVHSRDFGTFFILLFMGGFISSILFLKK